MNYQPSYFEQYWDDQEIEKVTSDLVRIRSFNPPGDERKAAEYCAEYLKKLGFTVQYIDHSDTRASVIAHLPGTEPGTGVMTCSHIDTVPIGAVEWAHDPFGGEKIDGKIWGRGSSDMKSGAASSLVACKALVESGVPRKGDLWVCFSAGEEVDFLGAKAIGEQMKDRDFKVILIPEPSSNEIYLGQKGVLWLEITMFGKTAHGSMPKEGINAVEAMSEFIHAFKAYDFNIPDDELLNSFTKTVTTIKGGVKTNVVPDECTISIDCRTLPGQSHEDILDKAREILAECEKNYPGLKTKLTVTNNCPAVLTDSGEPTVKLFSDVYSAFFGKEPVYQGVNFYTDSAVLVPELHKPMIIFGPGHAWLAHQPNEYVEVEKLHDAVKVYTLVLAEYLC